MAFKRKSIDSMSGTFDAAIFVQIGEAVLANEKLASFVAYLTSVQRNRADIKRKDGHSIEDHRKHLQNVYDADFDRWCNLHGTSPGDYLPKPFPAAVADKW